MECDAVSLQRMSALPDDLGQLLIEGVAKANVSNHASLEEGEWSDALCTVDDLVGDNKVARSHFFLERSNGGEGDDGAYADVSQRGYVSLVLDLMRRELVV